MFFYNSKYENDFRVNFIDNYFIFKLKSGDNVVDAGAYIGAFAVYTAKVVGPNGKVIAFKPDPLSYIKLLANIKLNKLKNIIVIKKGLWDKSTELTFYNGQGAGSSCIYGDNNTNPIIIKTVKLDEEIKRIGVEKIDFVKMDIEGAEIEVIDSLKNWLDKNAVNFAIASYHMRNNVRTSKRLEVILKECGYRAKTSFPEHLTTYASKE
ncbi:MAG: FkbM family methyltransferase [bacterium]|nr:FkbM family methyltransferase [bacterium]